jgi:hypothetical protein
MFVFLFKLLKLNLRNPAVLLLLRPFPPPSAKFTCPYLGISRGVSVGNVVFRRKCCIPSKTKYPLFVIFCCCCVFVHFFFLKETGINHLEGGRWIISILCIHCETEMTLHCTALHCCSSGSLEGRRPPDQDRWEPRGRTVQCSAVQCSAVQYSGEGAVTMISVGQ